MVDIKVSSLILLTFAIGGVRCHWGEWSQCTKSCGAGTQMRREDCIIDIRPLFCSEDQYRDCNTHVCPVDGSWGSWFGWSECSRSCGSGERSRTRTCSDPVPVGTGRDCVGSPHETDTCNEHECPVHGGWSIWGTWTECTQSCEGGTRSRNRTCSNPEPAHSGLLCDGNFTEIENCNEEPCPTTSPTTTTAATTTNGSASSPDAMIHIKPQKSVQEEKKTPLGAIIAAPLIAIAVAVAILALIFIRRRRRHSDKATRDDPAFGISNIAYEGTTSEVRITRNGDARMTPCNCSSDSGYSECNANADDSSRGRDVKSETLSSRDTYDDEFNQYSTIDEMSLAAKNIAEFDDDKDAMKDTLKVALPDVRYLTMKQMHEHAACLNPCYGENFTCDNEQKSNHADDTTNTREDFNTLDMLRAQAVDEYVNSPEPLPKSCLDEDGYVTPKSSIDRRAGDTKAEQIADNHADIHSEPDPVRQTQASDENVYSRPKNNKPKPE